MPYQRTGLCGGLLISADEVIRRRRRLRVLSDVAVHDLIGREPRSRKTIFGDWVQA